MRERALGLAVVVALTPEATLACASCAWSGFGDRSYNWTFLGLLALPFAVVGVVGGLIAREVRRPREMNAELELETAVEREPERQPATIEERT